MNAVSTDMDPAHLLDIAAASAPKTQEAQLHKQVLGRLLFEPGAPPIPAPLQGGLWRASRAFASDHDPLGKSLEHFRPRALEFAALWHPRLMAKRRSAGAFYTPAALSRWLVSQTLKGLTPSASGWRIADPCCGCGAFLLAVVDELAARQELDQLDGIYGIDVDPIAVEIARLSLWHRLGADPALAPKVADWIQIADGLEHPLDKLDAVVSNPPFNNAISGDTGRSAKERARLRRLMPGLAHGAYDLSTLFAARNAQRLRQGGRYGLVMPRSVLSVDSAGAMRQHLSQHAPLRLLWTPDDPRLFTDADVFVALMIGERGGDAQRPIAVSNCPPGPQGAPKEPMRQTRGPAPQTWTPLLLPERPLLDAITSGAVPLDRLEDHTIVHGGSATGAAYDLRPLVQDQPDGQGLRLITTGLIDRYTDLWGQRQCRYLRQRFDHPRWPASPDVPKSVARARARQADTPKILVAGLSKVLEAVCDPAGAMAGVVSTWVVRPRADGLLALWLLEALLNAPALSLVYMGRFRGKEMSGGNTTVGQRELKSLPVPADLTQLSLALKDAPVTPLPQRWQTVFDHADQRLTLARWAVSALDRPAGSALMVDKDAIAAACISALDGLDRQNHQALLQWFARRTGLDLSSPPDLNPSSTR